MKNLWKNLDKVINILKINEIKILMLDFDGTLTPIVKHPEEAKLSLQVKKMLSCLSKKRGFYLGIISGRRLEDIKGKIDLPNLIYAGNHGLEGEICKRKYSFTPTKEYLKCLDRIKDELEEIAHKFNGAFIEDNQVLLSFHYRNVSSKKILSLNSSLNKLFKSYKESGLISVVNGKKVYSIRPNSEWDKGYFLNLVIEKIKKKTKAVPIALYLGDDTTDEDVFEKLNKGITIKVGKNSNTQAKYYLKDTKETLKFLEVVNIEV